jgi:hypothetical protein
MSFSAGDILCIVDTAYKDQFGNWYALKLSNTGAVLEQGIIPSYQRACQLSCGRLSLTPPTQRRYHRLRSSSSTDNDRNSGSKMVPGAVIMDTDVIGYNVVTDAKQQCASTGSYVCVDKSSFKFPRPVILLGPIAKPVIDGLCKRSMDNGLSFCRPESVPAKEGDQSENTPAQVYTGDGSHVTVNHIAWVADQGFHCLLGELNEEDIQKLIAASLHPIVIYLEPKSTRKLSRSLGVKDPHATALWTFSQKEKERFSTSGVLTAKLQSGAMPQKTVTRTAELVKLLQEAQRWMPSVQLQK